MTGTPAGDVRPARSRVGRALAVTGVVVGGLVLLAVAGVLWFLHDLTTPDDGDRYADGLGERVAVGIADDVEGSYSEPLDAELLAQRAVQDPRLAGDAEYELVVLAWAGSSGDEGGAVFDLAISTEAPAWGGTGIFSDSRTAGSSVSCWQFVVRAHEHDDTADHRRVDCPDDLVPGPGAPPRPTPDPTPLPSLGADADATVLGVLDGLDAGVTPADAEAALREAFPAFVDVRATREGDELVATVGVTRSRDCVVAVRPDGEVAWRYSGFDRVQLEPGELGCDPNLYLAPAT